MSHRSTDRGEVACPYCGTVNDIHDSIGDPAARPDDGDCSVCFDCGRAAMWVLSGDRLKLRRPTSVELTALLTDDRVRRARAAIAESYSGPQAVRLARGLL